MKTSTLFLAALACIVAGCSTPSDKQPSAEADSPQPTETVALNSGAAADPAATTPEAQPETKADTPASAPAADAAKPPAAAPKPGDAAKLAPPRPAPTGGEGVRAEQRGGAQGGQGGGRQGGRGMNIGFLLRNEPFKKELNLTDDQIKKIEAAIPAQGQGGGQDTTPEERQKQRAEIQKKIEAVLKPEQVKRLKQLELQMGGTRALTRDAVAKELGLSADQVKRIEAALQVQRPQGGQGGAPGAGAGGGFDREAFMKLREEADKKAMAVLTPAQKTQWEAMLGKKFVFQMPQRGGGGGGIR